MKSLLHTKWKNILFAPLILLLALSTAIPGVSATPEAPYVYVDPSSAEISAVGENETIKIMVFNVTDLATYDFWLSYNNTLVDPLEIKVDGPNQVAPTDPNLRIETDVSVPGTIKYSLTFKLAAPTFNGSGVLAWITFEGLAIGNTTLELDPLWTKLYDYWGDPITTDPPEDGEISVVPEIPLTIMTPLLLIATLAATFLAKMTWSKKR